MSSSLRREVRRIMEGEPELKRAKLDDSLEGNSLSSLDWPVNFLPDLGAEKGLLYKLQ